MHDSSDYSQIIWQTRLLKFDLTRRGIVMGILNVTPDSFSDGGLFSDPHDALAHAQEMIAHGAEIIDVGGESTRPGAEPVEESKELRRVLPIIGQLAKLPGHGEKFVISIDTMKPSVARAAMEAGASIINDVSGLRDIAMIEAAKDTRAGVVVMHMQGGPQTMQSAPHYADVCGDVRDFFCQRLNALVASGVAASSIVFDPGIGFGKTPEHNLALLRRMDDIALAPHPIAVGVSRKSFIGKVLAREGTQASSLCGKRASSLHENASMQARCTQAAQPGMAVFHDPGISATDDRMWPTVALTCHAREHGARIFRVHDVKPNVEALRMTEAILGE